MIITRVINRFRKALFVKGFRKMELSSAIGANGCGRGCILKGKNHMTIGEECCIGEGSEIVCLDTHFAQKLTSELTIGYHVRMTSRCRITCAGHMNIGNDVLFAPEVFVTDHNHGMNPQIEGGYSKQPLIVRDVSIGDGTWIGQRACILPGVTIGEHCIIGAGSIVTHSIPAYSMAAGNPARVIKKWNFEKQVWEKC